MDESNRVQMQQLKGRFSTDLSNWTADWFRRLKIEEDRDKQTLRKRIRELENELEWYKSEEGNAKKPNMGGDQQAEKAEVDENEQLDTALRDAVEDAKYWKSEFYKLKDKMKKEAKQQQKLKTQQPPSKSESTAQPKIEDQDPAIAAATPSTSNGAVANHKSNNKKKPIEPNYNQPLLKNAIITKADQENIKLRNELKQANDQLANSKRAILQLTKENKRASKDVINLSKRLDKLSIKKVSRDQSLKASPKRANQEQKLEEDSSRSGSRTFSETQTDDEAETSEAQPELPESEKPLAARSLFKKPGKSSKPKFKRSGRVNPVPPDTDNPTGVDQKNENGGEKADSAHGASRIVINSARKNVKNNGQRRPLVSYRSERPDEEKN